MKLFSPFVIFFIIFSPGFLQARIKTPFEKPQLTWFYQHVVDRTLDYSFEVKGKNIFGGDTTYSYKGPLNTKAGGGIGFNLEVPHGRWFTFGFLLGIYTYAPTGKLASIFDSVGGRLSTRVQFFSRLQAPFRFGSVSMSPNLKISLGIGGGIQGVEGNVDDRSSFPAAPVGIPIGLQGGVDFYFGKWIGLEFAVQYLIEPGVDFMFPALVNKMRKDQKETADPYTTFAKEWSISFGIKSTYL